MPGKHCKKHTPITTKKQQGLFGAEYARKKAGKKGRTKMSKTVLKRHLKESKGKKLHSAAPGKFLEDRSKL